MHHRTCCSVRARVPRRQRPNTSTCRYAEQSQLVSGLVITSGTATSNRNEESLVLHASPLGSPAILHRPRATHRCATPLSSTHSLAIASPHVSAMLFPMDRQQALNPARASAVGDGAASVACQVGSPARTGPGKSSRFRQWAGRVQAGRDVVLRWCRVGETWHDCNAPRSNQLPTPYAALLAGSTFQDRNSKENNYAWFLWPEIDRIFVSVRAQLRSARTGSLVQRCGLPRCYGGNAGRRFPLLEKGKRSQGDYQFCSGGDMESWKNRSS